MFCSQVFRGVGVQPGAAPGDDPGEPGELRHGRPAAQPHRRHQPRPPLHRGRGHRILHLTPVCLRSFETFERKSWSIVHPNRL